MDGPSRCKCYIGEGPELKDAYPSFKLEDELFLNEGGGVVDAFIGRKYQQRARPREAQQAQMAQPTALQGLAAEEKGPTAA
jgi:hypothetical protein